MSIALQIPCPKCGRVLKLPDRSLLGRKGKCTKCAHVFILEEPPTVLLEEASQPAEPKITTAASPMTSPQRAAGVGTAESHPGGGLSSAEISIPPLSTDDIPTAAFPRYGQGLHIEINPAAPSLGGLNSLAFDPAAPVIQTGATGSTLKELRKRRRKGAWVNWLMTLIVLGGSGGAGYWFYLNGATLFPQATNDRSLATTKPVATIEEETPLDLASLTPGPRGEALSLRWVPQGTRAVLHLRPAELWQPDGLGEELRYCLGPLVEPIERKLQELSGRKPADIQQALLCLIPVERETAPAIAGVFWLNKDTKRSEFLDQFNATAAEMEGQTVFINEQRAYYVHDSKTFAVCPANLAGEMAEAVNRPHRSVAGLDELLNRTDSARQMTMLWDTTAIALDARFLSTPSGLPLLNAIGDWLGSDVDTVALSLHLNPDQFFAETLLRTSSRAQPRKLWQRVQQKLEQWPTEVLGLVQQMNPVEAGRRQLIGRFPAMLAAWAGGSLVGRDGDVVSVTTSLPDRAGPNLALAGLLAWDESLRTNFGSGKPGKQTTTLAGGNNLPEKVADRLKLPVEIDFRRTPLMDAIAYLADETKTTIEIDGDALKFSGYTKNMPQEFKLGKVPADVAIAKIFSSYDKLCLVVDEEKKLAIVTTYPFAEQKGLSPHKLPPAP